MWAMEYNPNIFAKYEDPDRAKGKAPSTAMNDKALKQYGKFERKNLQTGHTEESSSALAVFLVASVLEIKNRRILTEAKGVDDVVQVSLSHSHTQLSFHPRHVLLAFVSACMHISCETVFSDLR